MTSAAAAETLPGPEEVRRRVAQVLDAHWQPAGFTVPNLAVYPHQWLWDSCFHAVIWAHLGQPERATAELRNVFARQGDDGFVPHMTYWDAPELHASFWGRSGTSSITQPPMYGHAVAELARLGIGIERQLVDSARAGLEFLLRERDRQGAVVIVHPWESGCDDSPRWDAWCDGAWTPARWKHVKGELVASIEHDATTGSPRGNARFEVASSAFEALVAFNAIELASVAPDDPALGELRVAAEGLSRRTLARWDPAAATFPDAHAVGVAPSRGAGSAATRTLEALLPLLLAPPPAPEGRGGPGPAGARAADGVAFAEILSDGAFGGACGPAQVHRAEPGYRPDRYWRGGAWPQLSYLIWLAAHRGGRDGVADVVRDTTVRGAWRSGLAEYWHPDSGRGLGAVPQSWTGLIAVMVGS